MKHLLKITLVLLALLIVVPGTAGAHGAIFTYKYIDGENLVMVTHNVHDAQAGAPITYNLRLYTMDGQLIPFQHAKAEVLRGTKTVHTQMVAMSQNNEAAFVYTYPKQGNYLLKFTFLDNDKQVARGEFPIVVAAGLDDTWLTSPFVAGGIGLLLGVGAMKLYAERKRLKLPERLKNVRGKNHQA